MKYRTDKYVWITIGWEPESYLKKSQTNTRKFIIENKHTDDPPEVSDYTLLSIFLECRSKAADSIAAGSHLRHVEKKKSHDDSK